MSLPALLEQRLRLPVVAAPMFLVSNPQLVLACCRGGIVGSFPALNQRESSGFKAWLEEIEAGLDGSGAVVFHAPPPRRHAEKAAAAGVDGLIAVAAGAGGHAGTWSPFALIAEIRQFFDKTLLLAGCLNHGHEILAAQLLGADLAYLGTRFIATQESHAGEAYKQMLLDAKAADIIHTPAVSGIPASFMRQSLQAAGYDLQRLQDKGEVNYG